MVIYTGTSGSSERSGTGERLTLSVPAFPVSRIVTQDRGLERVIPGISGPRHGRSFGWWDPSGSCLRTYQASFLEMMDGRGTGSVYSESFPSWGLMLDGEFIAQPTPGLRTSEKGGGSWPTPVGDGDRTTNYQQGGTSLGFAARNPEMWPTPRAGKTTDEEEESWRARYEDGKVNTPPLGLAVKMHHIPTPTTADVYTGNMKSTQQSDGSMHSVSLPDYVKMFPTPSTMDHIERKGMRPSRAATNRTTGYLSEEVVRWATPNARDYKDTGENTDYHKLAKKSKLGGQAVIQVTKWPTPTGDDANNVTRATGDFQSLSREVEGSLNPDWVE